MELTNIPLRRRCGEEAETLAHILCEHEALASLRHAYLGSFFLDPEDIRSISLGAIWNFSKGTGLRKYVSCSTKAKGEKLKTAQKQKK